MKTLSIRALVLVMAGGLLSAACGIATAQTASVAPVKIGVPAAQTGNFAEFSLASLRAIQLAAEYVNRAGGVKSLGGARIEIVTADTRSDPGRATQLLQQMGAEGGMSALLGPMTSAEQLANLSTIDRLKIPLCSAGGDPKLTEFGSEYIFRVINGTKEWAASIPIFLDFASKQSGVAPKRVTVVSSMALGPTPGDVIEAAMKQRGYTVTRISYDPAGTKDYGPIVANVVESKPDVVTGYTGLGDGIQFAKAAERLKFQPPLGYVWLGGGQNLPVFKKNVGTFVNGWVDASQSAGWAEGKFGPRVSELAKEYEQKYGTRISALEASELACFSIVVQAVEDAKSRDPKNVRDAMRKMVRETDQFSSGLFAQAGGVEFDNSQQNRRWQSIYIQLAGEADQVAVFPEQFATGKLVWPAIKK